MLLTSKRAVFRILIVHCVIRACFEVMFCSDLLFADDQFIEGLRPSKLSWHAHSILNCYSVLNIWLLETSAVNILKNEVKHDAHKEAKSEAESSFDHIVHITSVKAFVHSQLLA